MNKQKEVKIVELNSYNRITNQFRRVQRVSMLKRLSEKQTQMVVINRGEHQSPFGAHDMIEIRQEKRSDKLGYDSNMIDIIISCV